MTLNPEKISILSSALEERYNSIHIIRERIQTVSLWIMGLLNWWAWWIFQSDLLLYCDEKLFLILFLILTFFMLKFFYFDDLEKWFQSQRTIAAKIEETLGFYEEWYFNNWNDSIYPKSWIKPKEWNFFRNNEYLVIFGFLTLIVAIIIYI